MQEDEKQLSKRFAELADRADAQRRYVYSEFLTLAEQEVLRGSQIGFATSISLVGGHDGAERCLAVFGDDTLCGYTDAPPVACVDIVPTAPKYTEALTHRDFLGALLGLGLRRGVLGDIIVVGNEAYLVCLDSVADFIVQELCAVRRTSVTCTIVDEIPSLSQKTPVSSSRNVASERLDALVAAVFNLSRTASQALIDKGFVFLNGRETDKTSVVPITGTIVSVRGLGRFIYEGVERRSKKGRLFVQVRLY
ncbi:YlmH/Sll1252 family protein [Oscillospiraceae bacterium WX1]